jgi:hypothetical protein
MFTQKHLLASPEPQQYVGSDAAEMRRVQDKDRWNCAAGQDATRTCPALRNSAMLALG